MARNVLLVAERNRKLSRDEVDISARSKHCSMCKHCIAKHDHHCIWINNCVGRNNMKWFLAFLLANVVTFTYATVTLYNVLSELRQTLMQRVLILTGLTAWTAAIKVDVWVGSLFVFAAICDVLVFSFLVYHAYLVFSGVTTNETLKFDDVKSALETNELAIYRSASGYVLAVNNSTDSVALRDISNVYDKGWYQNFKHVFQST